MAFGDAVLAAHGNYHWSCRERHRRIEALACDHATPWLTSLCARHVEGAKFELHPEKGGTSSWITARASSSLDAGHLKARLQERLAETISAGLRCWLWLEERRLGTSFPSARDYVSNPVNKCTRAELRQSAAMGACRNALVNLHAIGFRSLLEFKLLSHPRERVLHALALLLWEPAALSSPPLLKRLRSELNTEASGFPGMVCAYKTLWGRFN
jgi:hypothetical protein